jgi:2-methylcitrate dehydratase PrpD
MTTAALAHFVVNTRYADLPAETVEAARLCFLDWLGSAFAGSTAPPTRALTQLVEELGSAPQATLIPTGKRVSCLFAALVNAASSHVVEMDDLDKASIYHPGAVVIPAALALAEKLRARGTEFLRALVLGYEASIRIGEAVNPSHYRFWHTTGTVGTFGSAVACGALLGLSQEQLVWALGSAGTQAAGLWEFLIDGAMSKQLHPAKAAFNGMLSALLAQRGFTAATRILEGEKGFCQATAAEYDLEKITAGLMPGMRQYKISGVCFKKHASCWHTHPAIDAALELANKYNVSPQDIAAIKVKVYTQAYNLLAGVEAKSPYAAKFNLPYCVAVAFLYRDVGVDKFSPEYLADVQLRDLRDKVTLEADPELDALYPRKWGAVVEVHTTGGVFTARVDSPKGDPENPLTREELESKFQGLTAACLLPEQRERYLQKALRLEQIEDMSCFFE